MLSETPAQIFQRKAALKAVNFPSCSGGGSGDPAAESPQAAGTEVASLGRTGSGEVSWPCPGSVVQKKHNKAPAALGWECANSEKSNERNLIFIAMGRKPF